MKTGQQTSTADRIQRSVARLVATSPAGHELLLIGGYRYRLLDGSVRTSMDIDYHWAGDLEAKARELMTLFRKRLLPDIRRTLGFEGRADPATGPDADSPAVQTVVLSFWPADATSGRIEIPVEITRVMCADPTEVRTVDGTIYPTISDADLIESKIIAIFGRITIEHRDLLDVFLFSGKLTEHSPERIRQKLEALKLTHDHIRRRLNDLREYAPFHTKAIQSVVDTQLDREAMEHINSAGRADMILAKAAGVLRAHVAFVEG